jgi:hypothetical protein
MINYKCGHQWDDLTEQTTQGLNELEFDNPDKYITAEQWKHIIEHGLCWDCRNSALDRQTEILENSHLMPSDVGY